MTSSTAVMIPIVISSDEDEIDSKSRAIYNMKEESDVDDDNDLYVKSESDQEEDEDVDELERYESDQDLMNVVDTSRPFKRHLSKQRQVPQKSLSTKSNIIPWDSSDKKVLTILREKHTPWAEIATILDRTESSCKSTWARMQLSANRITLTDDVLRVFDEVYFRQRATIYKMLREEVNLRLKASGMLKHGQKISTQQVRQAFARHSRD